MDILIVATAIACATVGCVFFAFSSFVMPALKRLPPAQGIAAMQSINVMAITPVFMTAVFGTAAACLAVLVPAIANRGRAGSVYLIIGSLSYLIGCIGVTIAGNVPLNNTLAAVDASSRDAEPVWAAYLQRWTAWNHLRTLASVIAAGLLTMAVAGSQR